jgi:hypothetical protein
MRREHPRRLPVPMYRVDIEAHQVARWEIPASSVNTPAASVEQARTIAVGIAHHAANVPPWKPCVRVSLAYATAREIAAR